MRMLLILLLLPVRASADPPVIDELQVLEVDAPARPELELDRVELAIVEGRDLPEATGTVVANGEGWFVDDVLTGNYAVATVTVDQPGTWLLEGMAYFAVYVNRELRIGNVYGYKDEWEPWEPRFDFSVVPVHLHAGANELVFFGVRWGRMRVALRKPTADLVLNPRDATLPDLVVGQGDDTVGALPVLNATGASVDDAEIEILGPGDSHARLPVPVLGVDDAEIEILGPGDSHARLPVPVLAPWGVRKAGFPIRAIPPGAKGKSPIEVVLWRAGEELDRVTLDLEVKDPAENRRVTFVSRIDDSVQYFGYLPATGDPGPKALVLSLHGAAVEAINQSGSYAPLTWAHIVAPTNRRPFGFDWENQGRLDALEVLDLAEQNLPVDPDRIYLTGHSMGGHGTWHLATLHPDRFAAAGPSAGWITYWSYRREAPADPPTPVEAMVSRATLTSQTLEKAPNLAQLGLYVLHGADDDNVPPGQSHLIVDVIDDFHRDWIYHEEPGVGHWWDLSDEPGADCVAWAPMFDFFARHRRPSPEEVRDIAFLTPNPAVSAWDHWAGIQRQQRPFEMSSIDLHLDPWGARVSGTTANVEVLGLQLAHLQTDSVRLEIDGETFAASMPKGGPIWLERGEQWAQVRQPDPRMKGAHRNGGFRDAFTNRVQLVVGTQGSAEETAWAWAKARFDADYLWYQGNASIDVLADTAFDPAADPDRNVVLYGNADSHLHWNALLDEELLVSGGRVRLGDEEWTGAEFGVLAIRPREGSDRASVGIVSGTGLAGLRRTDRRPYLRGGFAFPDLTVLGPGVAAGFFGNDWTVEHGEFVVQEDD